MQDPITVSLRTGSPVIIDGHQRLRAASECGYDSLEALVKPFADELEEIVALANAALLRRQLSVPQKVAIAEARHAELAKDAEAKMLQGKRAEPKPSTGEQAIFESGTPADPHLNLGEGSTQKDSWTANRVAKEIGISPAQYQKARNVHNTAPKPVKDAWSDGDLSTHAAYTLANDSPEPTMPQHTRDKKPCHTSLFAIGEGEK